MHRKKHPKRVSVHAEIAAQEKAAKKAEFLQWYEQGGALYFACHKIGLSADTINRWRKEDAEFDGAIIETYERSTDNLKVTAYIRAMKSSDNLLMFLTKQRDPSYRDHFTMDGRHLHAGAISNPSKVPPSVQAAVDALSLDLVKKMAEKL